MRADVAESEILLLQIGGADESLASDSLVLIGFDPARG